MTDVRTQEAPATQQSRSGPNPAGGFIWYELMTTDPEGAKAFYDAIIGWSIGEATTEFGGYRMIGRSDGGFAGGVLPMTPEMLQEGTRPGWLAYLNVADVDAKVSSIESAGGKTCMPPIDIPNVGRVAMMGDPQGVPFYIMKPIPPADRPDSASDVFSPDAEQRVAWNELATSDQNAAVDFYVREFGWAKGEAMPMGDMGEYQLLAHDGVPIGAVMTKAADKPARWRFYIRVPDVDSAKRAIEAHGGTVVHGPVEVPGGDHILIGIDPQGAEFALVSGQ
jgi:predicted enzyme related to lactoylglutathione lyase